MRTFNITYFSKGCAVFLLILAMGIMGESSTAQALTAGQIQQGQQENDRIQRQQQLQQQEDMQKSLKTGRPQTVITVPPPSVQKGHGEGCRFIKQITLLNPVHMSDKEKDKLLKPYVGKCLGVNDIEKLMSDVTAFYINKGYVTTRVYLPAQDLMKGTLKLQIVAGKVSEITTDEKKSQIAHMENLFPGVVDNDLNLRDFEQGIDQINRLLSNNATIDIKPGEEPGESIVAINNNEQTHWHFNTTLDNYGAATTGRDQVGATASFDNIAGFEDFTSLGVHKTIPFDSNMHQASSENVLISVPFGYTTYTAAYTESNYNSSIVSGANVLHLNGTEDNASGTIDHVVYRDQKSKASVTASLTNDVTNTFIDQQLINVSSRTLTYATVGGNISTQIKGGTATASIGYTRGLRAFGALADQTGINSAVPHAQFDKYTLAAGYVKPFTVDHQSLFFSSQFSGQYAPYTLYGSQQFSIGGIYTVRGFVDEGLANDNGYYVRNDLTLNKSYTSKNGQTVSFRPFVAVDAGSVGSVHAGTQAGTLVGAAVGTDVAFRAFDFNILAGHPLIVPSKVDSPGFNALSRLSITF